MKSLKGRGAGSEEGGEVLNERRTLRQPPVTLDMIETAPSYEARADLVRGFVRQDREKAALVVRQLVETRP